METKLYVPENRLLRAASYLCRWKFTCLLIVNLLFALHKGISQVSLSFTPLTSDYSRPNSGAETWYNGFQVPISGVTPQDRYIRFSWSAFQSTSPTSYNWTIFDQEINKAIDAGQKFSFGLMTQYLGGKGSSGIATYGGGASAYPIFLHEQMQTEATKDYLSDGDWVPNYNSNYYLTAFENLCKALYDHISTTSYKGVLYKNVINWIDIRGYGNFGEFHNWPYGTGAVTPSNLRRIIDAHVKGFPDIRLSAMISGMGDSWSDATPEISYYLLTGSNAAGPFGIRRDNWGATESWYNQDIWENNPRTYNGVQLKTLIMEKWKTAPITGEPCCNSGYASLPAQVTKYHVTTFGNGNYGSVTNSAIVSASQLAGARIILTGGSINTSNGLGITLNWQNTGNATIYDNWNIIYELKNSSGTTVWSGNSSFNLKLFLPQTTPTSHTDNFTLPATVPAGTYRLNLIIKDPLAYRSPYPLGISGRNSDGSYTLTANLNISGGTGPSNTPPIANAGADKSITLPVNSTTLNGSASSDPDGTITSYQWSQVSGPNTATLSSTSGVSITVSNLVAGTYVFRLTVRDNNNATATDDITVTVNPAANIPPVANAGADKSITLPVNSTTLNGSASSDPDGTITSYQWQRVSGPNNPTFSSTAAASITVSNLIAGTYVFRLTVRDNDNATATDDIIVTVNAAPNVLPVAEAGANQTITLPTNMVTLNGGSSYDPDGTITSYQWQRVSGPNNPTFSSTTSASVTVSNLIAGTYVFRLTVRDNSNATSTDDVSITVNPAPNVPPVADAGPNITITLPTNSASLNGSASSDADGTITAYQWTQIGGPNTATFSSTTSASVTVSDLIAGTYVFRLTVRDNSNATSTDDVTVTVNTAAPSNIPPVANAGPNRTITLPTNSSGLNGSSSYDPDGTITSYQWSQVSGPNTATFSSTTAASVTVSNLVAGTYTFRLTVRDNNNATSTDDVTVIVNPPVNVPPVANAGPNRTITLPTNTSNLNGGSSYDPDGVITSYQWSQVSGPNTATFSSTTAASVTVSNLVAGTYVFRLTVRDNSNATATDEVTVIVNPAVNVPPVADAGSNRTITLPVNSTGLSGSASYDPDGTITSYQWSQVSGPNTATLSSTSGVSITVSNLVTGTYVFRLTVRDNSNATATDDVTIVVLPEPVVAANLAPVAEAGINQAITLTTAFVTLNGTGSYDPDGTITSYQWQQVSGPGNATITSATSAIATVSNLQAGDYVFRLTVRDNKNAVATDTVVIAVIDNFRGTGEAVIYPNPASNVVNVSLKNHEAGTMRIRISDLAGKQVLPITEVAKPQGVYTTTVDVSTLTPGTYVLEVLVNKSNKTVSKFLKL
jgi:hypothetical protein